MLSMESTTWATHEWLSWTAKELCNFIKNAGWSMKASEVQFLYDWAPDHQDVINAAGGLKRFVLNHGHYLPHHDFVWISGRGNDQAKIQIIEKTHTQLSRRRLTAAFAGNVAEYLRTTWATKDELKHVWNMFCRKSGVSNGGFATFVYLLQQWGVTVRTRQNLYRMLHKTDNNYRRRRPVDRDGAMEGERPKFLDLVFVSPVPAYSVPGEYLRLCSLDVYTMQRQVHKFLLEEKQLTPNVITTSNYLSTITRFSSQRSCR